MVPQPRIPLARLFPTQPVNMVLMWLAFGVPARAELRIEQINGLPW